MIYVSTNCVFDGSGDRPYREEDAANPISVYGASKLAGELAVQERLLRYYIVRTSWVFGPGGNNFVTKALNWARTQPKLRGAADEIATPTAAVEFGPALVKLGYSRRWGVYHLTNQGFCSRFDWLSAVVDTAGYCTPVEKGYLADFPRPSQPPLQSALANVKAAAIGVELSPWRQAVDEYVRELVPTAYAAR
jgi:dTDP-4-dehydrorhamnose reductase